MQLKFTRALQTHYHAIDRVMTGAFTPYVSKLGNGPIAGPYPWLEAAIIAGDVYVAIDGTNVVGVIATTRLQNALDIDQLGVDPERQGEGIGSWMLTEIEPIARSQNAYVLSLQTAEMMPDLLRFYRHHGYEIARKGPPAHGDDDHTRV